MNEQKKNGKPIKGVVCDVVSCVYHDGDSHCTAKQILIGPIQASSCTETVCATYKPHNVVTDG